MRRNDAVLPFVLLLMALAGYYAVRGTFHLGGSTPLLATATEKSTTTTRSSDRRIVRARVLASLCAISATTPR